uniref:Uncharacterized protein n=1 Tax=Trichobilharzia regenti TaxID=157069 RepID=A0AA85K8L3_TRIRE|nr:unnamed protein product [Trichobilharzia regenti]
MIGTQTKDKLDGFATSMCIYQFNCTCGDSYVGRTTRQPSQRVTIEHLPSWWFGKGQTEPIRSSILSHLLDSGHVVGKTRAFKVIHRVPPNLSNKLRIRLLHTAEAGDRHSNYST